jgi:MscS family membrane protein
MPLIRLAFLLLLAPVALGAQLLGSSKSSPPDPVAPPAVDSASPRAAVMAFEAAGRSGNFAKAATFMSLEAPEYEGREEELARRLKAVVDSRLGADLERLSPRAEGEAGDGLPPDREQIGIVTTRDGKEIPIRLTRVGRGDAQRWKFSPATVASIDELFGDLPDNWIRERLPEPLRKQGPFDVLVWQWIALFVLIPLSGLIGLFLGRPTRAVLRRMVARTETNLDDLLVSAARGPIILLWSVIVSRTALGWLALPASVRLFVMEFQQALAIVALFWMILRAITVLQDNLAREAWTAHHPALRSLIPLGGRIARVFVFIAAVLVTISQFGYPIATILAGLGIGGIAVALGAQKSLEHFFGSVSIGVDQPFRVGDWVVINGVEGEIEAIGLRSTRIRTLDRTVVSMPNGQLADAVSENFAHRERIRFRTTVGLEYGTSSVTLKRVRDEIEALLRGHPLIWPDRVVVRLAGFGAYSLDIELFCWIQTRVVDEFRGAREELMFGIMEIVERNGASFAFPTQTIHMAPSSGTTSGEPG